MSPIKISVVTAAFNNADTIEQALTAVASQTGVDAEHVVAHLSKTGARHQADIPGADHRDFHGLRPCCY